MKVGEHEGEFWGERLVCWSAAWTDLVTLPADARDYLGKVGLPTGVNWNFTIDGPSTPPTRVRPGMVELLRDGPIPICVDEKNAGQLVALEGQEKSRFVNSSIPALGRFLMIFQQYRVAVKELSEDEVGALIDGVEQEMKHADPAAMEDDDNYWPVVVEQMRDGML